MVEPACSFKTAFINIHTIFNATCLRNIMILTVKIAC